MVKKKSTRKKKGQPGNIIPMMPGSGGMEQIMRDIQKMFAERGVGSVDEANALMQEVMVGGGRPPRSSNLSALEHAQNLIYQAREARTQAQAVKLAKQALEISPDCADAYVLLAETANTVFQAKDLYQKGVEAGKRALGDEFEELEGNFWGFLETRPYMRAREGLANCLWAIGNKQEAIDHYRDILRLNPNDNQGIRYTLLNCLMETKAWAEAEKLLEQYGDEWSANWSYSQTLITFRKEGPTQKAAQMLQKALDMNSFVPAYLLGKKKLPRQLPAFISPGKEDEAIHYALEGILIWGRNKAALDWLQKMTESYTPKSPWGL